MKKSFIILFLSIGTFLSPHAQPCEKNIEEVMNPIIARLFQIYSIPSSKIDEEIVQELSQLRLTAYEVFDNSCTSVDAKKLKADYSFTVGRYVLAILMENIENHKFPTHEFAADIDSLFQTSKLFLDHIGDVNESDPRYIRLWVNLAKAAKNVENFTLGERYLIEHIHLLKNDDQADSIYSADFFRELGEIEREQGKYGEAKNHFINASSYYYGLKDWEYYAGTLYLIVLSHTEIDNFPDALNAYDSLQELASQFPDNQKVQYYFDLSKFPIAHLYGSQGKFEQGKQLLEGIINNPNSNNSIVANAYSNIGVIALKANRLDFAERSLEKSITLRNAIGVGTTLSDTYQAKNYRFLGNTYKKQLHFDSAYSCYRKSLAFLDSDPLIFNHREKAELYNDIAENYLGKFQRKGEQSDLQVANKLFVKAQQYMDSMRQGLLQEDERLFMQKKALSLYESAIKGALANNDFQKAFHYAEKSKANLLFSSIQEDVARRFANLSQTDLDKEYSLKRQISLTEKQLSGLLKSDSQYPKLLEQRARLKSELNLLIQAFERANPAYYALKYDNKSVDISYLQTQLPDSTSLIEYFAGEESWYIFSLTRSGLKAITLPRSKEKIERFSRLFIGQKNIQLNKGEFAKLGFELYHELLAPLREDLQKYLMIIPDAELNYLPFDVLLTARPNGNELPNTYPYLIREKALSYNFSAKLWQWTIQQQDPASWMKKSLVVFAPEFDIIQENQLSRAELEMQQHDMIYQIPVVKEYPPLDNMPGSMAEAGRLNELGATIYGPETEYAILGRFLKEAGKYRFIHLATHGTFDSLNTKNSYLAFRPVDNESDDERLYLSNLYQLRLNAEMVVLSACETQLGEFLPGEGNASLAQGFTYAGARSLIATRWKIKDAAKAELMALFYAFLKDGHNKAESLRQAKLQLMAQGGKYPSPYYWAAPIVMGDIRPVSFFSLHSPMVLVMGIGALIVLGLMVLLLWRRRSQAMAA